MIHGLLAFCCLSQAALLYEAPDFSEALAARQLRGRCQAGIYWREVILEKRGTVKEALGKV